ncbi:hypothetical protein ABZY81_40885, partial [Streptomyces sp. NPDC006514]
ELQRAVSDALGVQLLYTTGLFDTTALAEFPLVPAPRVPERWRAQERRPPLRSGQAPLTLRQIRPQAGELTSASGRQGKGPAQASAWWR